MGNEEQASKPRIQKKQLHYGQNVTLMLAVLAYYCDAVLEITREDGTIEHQPVLSTVRSDDGKVIVQFPKALAQQMAEASMDVRFFQVEEAGNIDPDKVNLVVHLQPAQQNRIILANQYQKIDEAARSALHKQN